MVAVGQARARVPAQRRLRILLVPPPGVAPADWRPLPLPFPRVVAGVQGLLSVEGEAGLANQIAVEEVSDFRCPQRPYREEVVGVQQVPVLPRQGPPWLLLVPLVRVPVLCLLSETEVVLEAWRLFRWLCREPVF